MAPLGSTNMPGPGPTNVVVLSKIPEGITEQQISMSAGGYSVVLSVSFREADLDGPGWAILTFANPELAKAARERLDGKPLPGAPASASSPLGAALGEGLYGPVRRAGDTDGPWKEARTPQGQLYYYHTVSRQTTWTKPPVEFAVSMPGAPPPPGGQSRLAVPPPPATPPPPGGAPRPGIGYGTPPPPVPPPPAQVQAQAVVANAQQVAATAAQHAGGAAGDDSRVAGAGPIGANMFIYHIPNSWDDQIMRQHFEHFGTIVSCRVQKDGEGRPRGFGFVSYTDPAAAQAAIAGMHGFPVDGKHLKVQLKKGDEQATAGGLPAPPPAPPPPAGGPPRPGPY